MSLFNELKRRNVFKVSIGYVVMAWLVMQVADVILNNIEAPGWVFHVLLLFLSIGLPFAVFFAWAFELTPEGLKREHEVDRSESITSHTGRKLDFTIIGVLVLALGYFAYDKLVLSEARDAALVEAAQQALIEQVAEEQATAAPELIVEADNSIAVLPFADMSPNKDQDYFSDGLSEELLNLLAKIPELRVAARTSSFSFKGQNLEITDIAERLKVAHVLEGSVRMAGNQIRITAQLIKADDGYHMWSETYDRSLDNVFAIQDEIAQEVVAQLKVTLLGAAPTATKVDPNAYALFLRGRQLSRDFSAESIEQANAAYEQALVIDPGYAEVWAELSRNYINQTNWELIPLEEGLLKARQATSKAVALNPGLATGAAQAGWMAMNYDNDFATAALHFERALQLDPSNLDIIRNISTMFLYLGRLEQAIEFSRYVIERDPVNPIGHSNIAGIYGSAGRIEESLESFQLVAALSPNRIGVQHGIGMALLVLGQFEAALQAFSKESDEEYSVKGSALAYFSLNRMEEFQSALDDLQTRWGQRWPGEVAQVYAWAGQQDKAFEWLEKAALKGGVNMVAIITDPLLKPLHGDPRWGALLEKAGFAPQQLELIELNVALP